MNKLNLGCGINYRDGYINTDMSKEVKTDICFDLRKEFPFQPNTADEVLILSVVGCILTNEDFMFVMNNCWNVLIPGGTCTLQVPSARFSIAFKDPTECRHFTEETWDYFIVDHYRYKNFGRVYGFKPWSSLVSLQTDVDGIMTVTLKK